MSRSNVTFGILVILGAITAGLLVGRGHHDRVSMMHEMENARTAVASGESAVEVPKPTEKKTEAHESSPLLEFLKSLNAKADWSISAHGDGSPAHILGGQIPLTGSDGYAILKGVAKALGVGDEKLRPKEKVAAHEYFMEQYEKGFKVYGAQIKAFADDRNTEIYHIANELRVIKSGNWAQNKTASQAADIVRQKYNLDSKANLKMSKEPYVYGTSPTDNSLVWRVQISRIKDGLEAREVLVSASTGEIVLDRPIQ